MKRFLFIRLSALGDIILTSGVLEWIKQQDTSAEIHFLTHEKQAHLLSYFRTKPDKIHTLNSEGQIQWRENTSLSFPFDAIFDWQGTLKSYRLCRKISNLQRITLTKQSFLRRFFVLTHKGSHRLKSHITEKYWETYNVYSKNIFFLEYPIQPKMEVLDYKFQVEKTIVIHPFASQLNKEWPHSIELIKKLLDLNERVTLLGQGKVPDELQNMKHPFFNNKINKTSLPELIEWIAASKAVISTDSGPLHLATAFEKPTIALFGPTTKEFGFYPEFKGVKILELPNLECRPCHIHGGNYCHKQHHRCMVDLTVDSVLRELKELL